MSNNVTPLTPEKQLALRNKAKLELIRLNDVIKDNNTKQLIDNFKDKFSVCEIVYKIILDDHQYNKTGKHPEKMYLTMNQVPFALDYAGYNFEKLLLTKLFGTNEKVGQRSVKSLRNALTHNLSQSSVDELKNRYNELNEYMDLFLEKIYTYDVA